MNALMVKKIASHYVEDREQRDAFYGSTQAATDEYFEQKTEAMEERKNHAIAVDKAEMESRIRELESHSEEQTERLERMQENNQTFLKECEAKHAAYQSEVDVMTAEIHTTMDKVLELRARAAARRIPEGARPLPELLHYCGKRLPGPVSPY